MLGCSTLAGKIVAMYIVAMYRIQSEFNSQGRHRGIPRLALVDEVAGGGRPGGRAAGSDSCPVRVHGVVVRHVALRAAAQSAWARRPDGPGAAVRLQARPRPGGLRPRRPHPGPERSARHATVAHRAGARRHTPGDQDRPAPSGPVAGAARGQDSPRAREFTRELATLLDAPLDPHTENDEEQS